MSIEKIKEKLKKQSQKDEKWLQDALYRQENESWLDLSFAIAVKVLEALREKGITQKHLAEKMGLSPQYINKVVKGSENLTLYTITRLEKALSIKLIAVPQFEFTENYKPEKYTYTGQFFYSKEKPVAKLSVSVEKEESTYYEYSEEAA